MKGIAKRTVSIFLSLVMLATMFVGLDFSAFAKTYSGSCGKSAYWELDTETGKLLISGTGSYTSSPWSSYSTYIKSVKIDEGITNVYSSSFESYSNLVDVQLPSTLISIGNYAFASCSKLTNVVLPEGLTSIGYDAFYYCTGLTNIDLPEGLTSIGDYAFRYCSKLTNIDLPEGLISIGYYAFGGCNALRKVNITDLSSWCSIDFYNSGANPLYNSSADLYLNGEKITNLEIPYGIKSICPYSFAGCKSINDIVLPDSVSSIDTYAFYNCGTISSIMIPESVKKINAAAFGGTTIGDVYFECSEEQYSDIYILKENDNFTSATFHFDSFMHNHNYVDEVCTVCGRENAVSSTINGINWKYYFDSCKLIVSGKGRVEKSDFISFRDSIKSVVFEDGITSISYNSFSNCKSLKKVMLPDSLLSLSDSSFYGCDSIEEVEIGSSLRDDYGLKYSGLLDSSNLKKITVSKDNDYLKSEDGILYSKDMKTITKYPAGRTEKSFTIPSGVLYVDYYTFKNCQYLENIVIGSSVKSIYGNAISFCPVLKSITTKGSFSIGRIYNCPMFNTIILSNGATSDNFFSLKDSIQCEKLNVDIESECTDFSIIDGVLYNGDCSRLYYVFGANDVFVLPRSVDRINNRAFEDSDNIIEFRVEKGNPSYKAVNGVLFDSYKEHLVKYPSARADESYTIPSGTEFVNKNAFQNIKYLNEVTIPNSVTSLYSSSIQNPEDHYIIKNVNVGSYACNYYTDMNDPDLRVTSFNVRDEMYLDDAINVTYRDYANKQRLVYSFTADESIDYEIKVKSLDSDYYDFALKVYDSTGTKIYSNNRKDGAMVSFEEGQTYYISFNLTGSTDDYSLLIRKYIKDETYKDGIFYHLDAETMTASVIGPISERYKYSIPARVDGYTVTSIEDYAFNYCEFLTRVNLPATIETIGNGAFADCPNLDYVYIDSSNPNFYVDDNEVIYNADMTELVWFPSYIDLTSFDIPNGVTRINGGAFQGNKILESVTIPNTVLTIGECAFSGTKLSTIIIPSSVATVGEYAFAYNNDLEFVTFMSNETTIGDDAFYESTGAIKASVNSKAKTYADKNKIRFIDINSVEGGASTDSCKHNFVVVNREESNCVHSGLVTYACEYCHTVYSQVIEISSHSFIAEKTEATPNKQGFEKFTCAICGYSYIGNIIPYATDKGALESAIKASYSYHSVDYCSGQVESLVDLCSAFEDLNYEDVPQTEIDNAVAEILTAQAEMTPYFNINVTAENGIASVEKQTVLKNATVVVEATGNDGYDFVGWYDTDNNIYMSKSNPYSFKASSNVNLKAVFVASNTATLTFANYSGWVAGVQTKTVAQWTLVTTIAPLLPAVPYRYGYTNGRWVYDNLNVLSKLKAGENVTLVPEYDSLELEMPEAVSPLGNEPVLKLGYSYDENNKVGSFLMTAGVPNTVKIEAVGVAFYYHSATSFDPTDNFNLLLNNKLLVSQFNVDEPQEQYIVNINNLSSKYNWAARGYITYTIDDETKTVYSNQINIIDRHQV